MIKVKKSPGKRGIQWKLQLGSLYDVSLVGGKLYFHPTAKTGIFGNKKMAASMAAREEGDVQEG